MKMNRVLFIFCLAIMVFLFISPASAVMVTAKVDDKGLIAMHGYGIIGTLHTCYGSIAVEDEDYNDISVNDTIKYDTDFKRNLLWADTWEVEKVN